MLILLMNQKMETSFLQVHKITVWITLFAALLTCAGQAGEFVICLGEDGHIAIETVVNWQYECDREVYTHDHESLYVSHQDEVVYSHYYERNHSHILISMNNIGKFIAKIKYNVTHNQLASLFYATLANPSFEKTIQKVFIIELSPDINPALVSIRTVISLS